VPWVVPAGALIAGTGLALLALEHGRVAGVAVLLGVLGLGSGCAFASMPALIIDNVPHERTGSAAGVNQVLLGMGGALGSAFAITLLAAHRGTGAMPLEEGYTVAFVAAAVACVAAAGGSAVLRPPLAVAELDVNIKSSDTARRSGAPAPEENATR
jgi:MFS family permease